MFLTPIPGGKHQPWRFAATIILTLLALALGQIPLIATVSRAAARAGIEGDALNQLLAQGGFAQLGMGGGLVMLLTLLPFALALGVLLICVVRLHRWPLRALFTGRAAFDYRRFAIGAALWFALAGGAMLLVIPEAALRYQFNWALFWPMAGIALALLPLQVGAEELFFRGYLLKSLALLLRRPIWPMLITSLLFGAGHFANPEVASGALSAAMIYLGLSLFFGLLTVLDDGLELPLGIHLANNLFTALVLSTSDGAMNTDSVFQTTVGVIYDHLWVLALVIPVMFAALHALYRFPLGRLWVPIPR